MLYCIYFSIDAKFKENYEIYDFVQVTGLVLTVRISRKFNFIEIRLVLSSPFVIFIFGCGGGVYLPTDIPFRDRGIQIVSFYEWPIQAQ